MSGKSLFSLVVIGLVAILIVHFGQMARAHKMAELSDPAVTEVGWCRVVDRAVEPISEASYVRFSLTDNPADTNSFRLCWVGPDLGYERITRFNDKKNRFEVYVISRNFDPGPITVYFAMKEAKILRADK